MSRIPEQAKIDFDAMLDNFDGTDIKFTDSDSENHSMFASIANVDAYDDFVNDVKQNYKELIFDNSITPEFINYTDYGYISVEFTDDDRINLNVNYDRAVEDDEDDTELDETIDEDFGMSTDPNIDNYVGTKGFNDITKQIKKEILDVAVESLTKPPFNFSSYKTYKVAVDVLRYNRSDDFRVVVHVPYLLDKDLDSMPESESDHYYALIDAFEKILDSVIHKYDKKTFFSANGRRFEADHVRINRSNDDESINEELLDDKFTEEYFNKYAEDIRLKAHQINNSIQDMISKHSEYADLFDNLVSDIVDIFTGSEATVKNESYIPAKTLDAKAQDIADYLGEFMNDPVFLDKTYFDDTDIEAMANTFDALNDFVIAYRNGTLNESDSLSTDKSSKDEFQKYINSVLEKLHSYGLNPDDADVYAYAEGAAELIAQDPHHDIEKWWKETLSNYRSDLDNMMSHSNIEHEKVLSTCPNCGNRKFNDKIGLCIDCGYDEKSHGDTGTDDYFDESLKESAKKEYTDEDKKQLIDDLVKRFFTEEEAIKLVNKDIAYAENLAYGNCTTEDFIEAEDWLANN